MNEGYKYVVDIDLEKYYFLFFIAFIINTVHVEITADKNIIEKFIADKYEFSGSVAREPPRTDNIIPNIKTAKPIRYDIYISPFIFMILITSNRTILHSDV